MDKHVSWYSTKYKEEYDKVIKIVTGYPTKYFWDEWKKNKEKYKEMGYRVYKQQDKYVVALFKTLNEEEVKKFLEKKKSGKHEVINNDNVFKMKVLKDNKPTTTKSYKKYTDDSSFTL